MGTIVMNMSSGKIEHTPSPAEYDDEVLSAGWNPVVSLEHAVPAEKQLHMPAELATVDAELFLKKMYGCLS
jgi:hypothetical protein